MPRGGKPCLLKTRPEIADRVIKALQLGASHKTATRAAGLGFRTFYSWIKEGESGRKDADPAKVEFAERVRRAEGEAEMTLLSRIHVASNNDWRSAAWILERRFPEEWAATFRIEAVASKQASEAIAGFFDTVMADDSIAPEAKQRLLQHAQATQGQMLQKIASDQRFG